MSQVKKTGIKPKRPLIKVKRPLVWWLFLPFLFFAPTCYLIPEAGAAFMSLFEGWLIPANNREVMSFLVANFFVTANILAFFIYLFYELGLYIYNLGKDHESA